MLRDYLPVLLQIVVAILFAGSALGVSVLVGKSGRRTPAKDMAYECGMIPQGEAQPRFSVKNRRQVAEMLEEFKPVAEGHGLSYAQLVMAWTAAQPGLTHVLAGARNPKQAKENAKAGTVELTAEEIATMNAAIRKHAENGIHMSTLLTTSGKRFASNSSGRAIAETPNIISMIARVTIFLMFLAIKPLFFIWHSPSGCCLRMWQRS
jgi:hypothetical protein